jgi:hypothetical protein
MSETPDFRNWAARMAGQASEERNASEAQRLRSIAGCWERLADIEDWQGEGSQATEAKAHQRAS